MQKWAFNISCITIGVFIMGSICMSLAYATEIESSGVKREITVIPYMAEKEILAQPEEETFLVKKSVHIESGLQDEECEMEMYPQFSYSRDWTDEEKYLLAKIAMAEAEGSTTQCKTLIIMTVLNRVDSSSFPDSIQEVIFQYDERSGIYQFSCIGNGRWDKVEPDQDCEDAVALILESEYDYSGGALYFESCPGEDNWHSQKLEYLYQCGEFRFYK